MNTCARCYRVLVDRNKYLYRVEDVEVRLCHECYAHVPTRLMPDVIRCLAEQQARRLSLASPRSMIVVEEYPSRYVEPPKRTWLTRLTGYLERSLS